MRRATTTTNSLTPWLAGRSAFSLTEREEQVAISFLVDLRRIVRRAAREGYGADDVLEAFTLCLSGWPADRSGPILRAVDDLIRLPAPRPAMIPGRVTDVTDFSGDAA